ncbi:MAG: asparaginase [Rubrobacteraceae bacterium]
MALPKVIVLSLGGTISSVESGGGGVSPSLTGEALIEAVPEISDFADVSASSVRQIPGSDLSVDDLVEVAREATRQLDEGAAGVVITQGTDSIEETAFVMDLLVDREHPVVVTGAMRNPTLPGADGPANLLASVQVAASGAAQGVGAVVVFNDEIHSARHVQKTHTQSPATFRSAMTGPIGWISENQVRIAVRPVNRYRLDPGAVNGDHTVALLKIGAGDDGRLIRAVGELGYSGLVIEGLGGGHVPSVMVEPLSELADKMPVVLASRTGSGEVLRNTYDFPGSEMDLIQHGLIRAGILDGLKARLLLTLLLRSGASTDRISTTFDGWFQS